jgi:catalase
MTLLQEAYRHCKVLGAWGTGAELLTAAGVVPDDGVLLGETMVRAYTAQLFAMGLHRVWDRALVGISAGASAAT